MGVLSSLEVVEIRLIDIEDNYIEPRRNEINKKLLAKGYIYKDEK